MWLRAGAPQAKGEYLHRSGYHLVLFHFPDLPLTPLLPSSLPAPSKGKGGLSSTVQPWNVLTLLRSYSSPSLCFKMPSLGDMASLIAQVVKNLTAMQETPVRFLAQEDLLEKG